VNVNLKIVRGLKNASYLVIGNFISQVISFFAFIYVARNLGPNDYGIYVTVGAFVGMFDIILLGGLEKVVIREGSKDISHMHIILEKTIGVKNLFILFSIISCIIISFFAPYGLRTKFYIILMSATLAYSGVRGFLGTIYQATEKMQYLAIFNILNRLLFVILVILVLNLGFGLLAIFIIAIFSHFSILLINYQFSHRIINFNFFSKIQFDKQLLKPALLFTLIGFMGYFVTRVDLLMISFLGTENDVGIYGVAYKLSEPGIILRNIFATAFFPILVKRFHNNTIKGRRLIKYSLFFLLGLVIVSSIASYISKELIIFFLGAKYEGSVQIFQILIFFIAFSWAALPFTTAALATQNEKFLLVPVSIMGVLNVLLNYILFLKYGVIGIAYATLVVFAIGGFLYCFISYTVMKKQGHLV
jgi:O-antigen/teichoic acid export membrane protein